MFFFFNDTATTEIYTLSLHDALPISGLGAQRPPAGVPREMRLTRVSAQADALPNRRPSVAGLRRAQATEARDRKSTRLNSSHANISYAVFCLKKLTNSLLPDSLLALA